MFNMSSYLHLLHCVLNFVFKSATEFIFRDKRNRKKRGRYEIARSDKFKADYRLDDDNGITFIPPVFIQRYHVASDVIRQEVARSTKPLKVVDFGCAEISYFEHLRRIDGLEKVLCIDVDEEMLQRYHRRAKPLNYNHLCPREAPFSVDVLAGSIAECDPYLLDTDVVICIELIEHLWPHELNAVPWTIFGYTQPKVAVFTTPNVEFNVMFKGLKGFRHDDHKFEWTREEFEDWAENIVLRFPNYEVHFSGIGPGPVGTEHLGCVSQMAIFTRKGSLNEEAVSSIDTKACYKKIESYEYPFFIDTRTDAEKIRDEVAHHRIRLAYLEPYVDQDIPKIELSTLLKFVDRCQSIEKLKTILESFGTVIEENENGDLCVVGMDDDSSKEEEGYLTGDADTENAYSDWGTFKANEWPTSPAWDATAVTNADWDAWDESVSYQNRPSSPNEQISEEFKVSAVLETSHVETVETNSQTLTRQNRGLEEFHHLSDKSLTSDHEQDSAGTKLSELEVSSVPQIDHIEREESNPNNLTGENVSLKISHQINNTSNTLQNERNPPEKKCDQPVIFPVCEQKSQTLYSDLTYLQLENLQYMNTHGAIRAAQSSLRSEIPELENRVRELITDLISASSHLGPLQNSIGIIRHLTLDLQVQENSNNSISSPAPPRYINAMGQKRMNLEIFPKNMGVALNSIEEVSQEISTTSPQVSAKKAPRYERKCKKGLRHLVSTRKSSEVSKEPSDQSNVCLSNTNHHEEGDRVEDFKSPQSVHCEENSPKCSNKSDSGSSMELTPKVGNAGVSEDNTTPQSEDSPLRCSRKSSSTLNPSSTPRKYSDVLKSAEKRNDGISFVSRSSNLEAEPQQEFSSRFSDIESTLQGITVRRGTSHRKVLRTEPSFSGSYIPHSSTETPGNIVCKTEPREELEYSKVSNSENKANFHKVRDTFTFYVFKQSRKQNKSINSNENESTLKALGDNEENLTPIVNKGKKVKKTRKLKSTSSSCSLNRTSLMSANEVNIAANLYNSTPIESSKPQQKKRNPLATLVSSTIIASNDSAVSQESNIFE